MNSKMQVKISLEEILYYLMFSILLFTKGIGLDEGSLLFRACLLCATGLFCVKIFVGRYSIIELILIGLGLIWGVYIFFHVGSLGIFVYSLMLFGMKNISVHKVFKVGAVVWSGCMLFTITAAIFFDRTGVRLVHEKLGMGPLLRESLGYTHPNVLHISYIVLMAFVLYLCKKENVKKTIALLMVGNAFVFMYSISYTGLLISVVLVVVYIYFLYRSKFSKIEEILIRMVLPVCIIVSIILPPFLNSEGILYRVINALLNNRVWAMKYFFDEYEITLLGEKILLTNYSLDNSFIFALAWYGVVFLVIVVLAYGLVINIYIKENRRMELVVIISFLIAGLTEQFLFNASIKNVSVIFLGEVLFQFTKEKIREFDLGCKWNILYNLNIRYIDEIRGKVKLNPWNKSVLIYIITTAIILIVVSLLPIKQYKRVYVNERQCHCDAELVNLEQIEDEKEILLIGNINQNDEFYYFTRENSNLIEVMEFRYKFSLGIYISFLVIGLGRLRKIIKC